MSSSIQESLTATSLPLDQMTQTYAPFLTLTTRILGHAPHFLSLAHSSPLTHIFYLAALRPCFHLPECDLHLLKITPAHRRAALLESSITHQCAYCTAHVAAMGDVVRGPLAAQCARRGDLQTAVESGDEAVTKLVGEVCGFPGVVTPETRGAFVERFGETGYRQLASMVAFMGWLNFTMGAAGMRLEGSMLPFAEAATKNRRLPFDIRKILKKGEDDGAGRGDVDNVRRRGVLGMVVEHVKNVWGMMGLVTPVATAGIAERKWFAGIPSDVAELTSWGRTGFGIDLKVFNGIPDPVLKRALALGLKLVFLDDDPLWTPLQKSSFLYVFASGVMDQQLLEDSLRLFQHYGGDAGDIRGMLTVARLSNGTPTDAYEAALKFVHAAAGFADNVGGVVVDGLVGLVGEHRSIVDVCGMIGHFGFWHRASVLYPC